MRQGTMQIVRTANHMLVDGGNQIAVPDTSRSRTTVALDGDHLDHGLIGQVVIASQAPTDQARAAAHTKITPPNASLGHQLGGHPLDGIGGNRKADALRPSDDRRVQADDPAVRIDQRPTRVTGVQRRGVLNDILDQPPVNAADRPPQRG